MQPWRLILALLAGLAMLVILALFVLLPDTGHFTKDDDEVPISTADTSPAASADLSGPTQCVKGPFRVRVTGEEIARVTFSVNGRRSRTAEATDGGTQASYRVDPAGQDLGVHRLHADVTYTDASTERDATLRLVYKRCSRKAATPRFTG